ncbi:hypothetical protein [Tychonema sp. LEGE 07203]|uniref:hypothetical protein n=1 Tax=Tychonema sp. LEGE 07203 TaxID=1828671 RepID=UPI001882659E|nr:hypothetical protein [Tychonema sp. LEGE 07203]MBE9092720.1 hypothetical protein [Tychonema sp. LEGE 07203]
MITSDQKIKAFFQQKILDVDDDEIDKFLKDYSNDQVIQCLFDKLKSLSKLQYCYECSWLLGRVLGGISNKYSADTQLYSLLNTSTIVEKQVLLNFLSGYWDNAKPNIEIVVTLAEDIAYIITNPDELKWDRETICLGMEAVALGYLNNKQLFHFNKDRENKLRQTLKNFMAYLSNFAPEYPAHQLLLKHFN